MKIPLLASACTLALLAAWPLSATTVVGTGTPASCTEAALNAAISEANGTFGIVTFNCGPAQKTILLSGEKALANGVIIDGGGKIVLSGNGSTRIFNLFLGAAVGISNITLTRGRADAGGCVLAFGTTEQVTQLSLDKVRLLDCEAANFGGALAGYSALLTITNSVVEDNYAGGGGGGISLNQGNLLVQNSELFFNSAETDGGAVQAWFSEVTIEHSTFHNNGTFSPAGMDSGGGALSLLGFAFSVVRGSTFYSNRSVREGGGVRLTSGANATFHDSRFEYNSASTGGGLFVDFSSSGDCERCSFSDNEGSAGGGAIGTYGTVLARNSTFYYNVTGGRGAALLAGQGALYLASATLVQNFNVNDVFAGQIAWTGDTRIEVHNSLIQASDFPAAACSPGGLANADFTFSIWSDFSCPAGIGSQSATVVPLRPYGFSCGGAATERTPTLPPVDGAQLDAGFCRPSDPLFDQRGMPRPNGAACDVGATEFFEPCDAPLFYDGFESGFTTGWSFTVP